MKSKPATRTYSQKARAEAAEATAQRIIEAFLARLMKQWFDEITLDGVAADAGVTVQTIVRRFGGKDGLLAGSVPTLGDQIKSRRAAPSGDVDRLVARVVADYEVTGDAVIRLLALEGRHPALKRILDYGRGEQRQWVMDSFATSLGRLEGAARIRAVDALVAATDVYTWKLFRRDMGRGVPATVATMSQLVRAALDGFSDNQKRQE